MWFSYRRGLESVEEGRLSSECPLPLDLTSRGSDVPMSSVHPFAPVPFTSPFEVKRRVEDIRLLESRRSPRLMDSEVDFAKLADVGVSERKRNQVDRDI
ncbi:unnamed protein product, partial [Cyprideis torosa]